MYHVRHVLHCLQGGAVALSRNFARLFGISINRRRLNSRTTDHFGPYMLLDPTNFSKMLNDVGGFEDEDE
jgi:hypothetical protein